MKHLSRLFMIAILCGFSALAGCASTGADTHSGGRPVNPEADPGGQGVPGSRSTGVNTQGTPGRP